MSLQRFQHLDDIEIPEIEIDVGWLARDVATLEDCDDAFAVLTGAAAAIEAQLEAEAAKPVTEERAAWTGRAKAALRYKRAALQIVSTRRSAIAKEVGRQHREAEQESLLAFIRAAVPAQQWLAWVNAHNTVAARDDAA